VFKGEHVDRAPVEVVRCRSVEIAASEPFTMYADGDPIAELPVTVRILAGAVRAVVPPPAFAPPPEPPSATGHLPEPPSATGHLPEPPSATGHLPEAAR
jgi:hypothetical protein